jgi:phosphatidylglycerol lysyltransferase
MGFLVQVDLSSHPEERRIFVAECQGRLIGFLALAPVYSRGGWLLEDLLREPAAPNGTAELLIDHAMRTVGAEGCRYATLGMAPLSGTGSRWLRMARALGSRLYNFEGLRAFKAKLRPGRWEPLFLSYPPRQSVLLTVMDALAAFAPQGLARFALETLIRTPGPVLRGLALLLIPWTLALALADTARWFPHPGVQLAWVLFDLCLVAGLLQLSARWQASLATLLAVAITTDAVLTLIEVGAFNIPRATQPLDLLVAVIAVLAPTLAALFLWAARAYHRRVEPSA